MSIFTSLLHLLSQTQEDGNLPVLSLGKQQGEGEHKLQKWDVSRGVVGFRVYIRNRRNFLPRF